MANQQMNPIQQNLMARHNLLTTGIPMMKRLQPVTGGLGSTLRIPLLRMGIMTGVLLQFTVPVTIATAAAVVSPRGPWNLAQMVSYNDFAGVQRTRTNGYQLWVAQSFKSGDLLSSVPSQSSLGGTIVGSLDTDILAAPTAVGNGNIYFSLYVPMAYDPNSDLTGAVLTQTNVGEHFINVQLANSLLSADPWVAPYVNLGGGGTVALQAGSSITCEAFQYYIQPQNMDASNLPLIDLSTIYGFEGAFQNTSNIAANQSTFINFPNNRSIMSALFDFENGSDFTPNGTDLSGIVLIANSNTNFKEYSPRALREHMRNIVNGDAPHGAYYMGFRRQPILTQLYANVQSRFDVASVTAGVTQFVSQFEVQYPSGSPLPGITTGSM